MYEGVIYQLKSPSGLVYVGRTINLKQRLRRHRNNANNPRYAKAKLYQEMSKYGFNSFEHSILKTVNGHSRKALEEQLDIEESAFIISLDTVKNGLNERTFEIGTTLYRHKDETKKKIANANTGRKHSKESIERRSGINAYQGKQVYSASLNKTFDTLKNAAIYVGLCNGCKISECINGKRKSAGKHPETQMPITDWIFI